CSNRIVPKERFHGLSHLHYPSRRFLMRAPRVALAAAFLLTFGMGPAIAQEQDAKSSFQAGFAERDITPEIGMEQPGGYGKAFHRSVHDPCKVRAGVFSDGTGHVAVVSVDALLVHRPLVDGARKRIEAEVGIPGSAVLIHATHSHSSGPTGMIYPGEYDFADEFIQELAYEKSSNANLEYVAHVEDQIVDAVKAANAARGDVTAGVGKGLEEHVAFNRRFFMKN